MIVAAIPVFLLPGLDPFRTVAGLVLLVIEIWLIWRTVGRHQRIHRPSSDPAQLAPALGVGTAGGVFGIGGDSILNPILVGSGMAVAAFAPRSLRELTPIRSRSLRVAGYGVSGSLRPGYG